MPRVRALRRYKNSSLRRRLQTGPQNINRLGTRKPVLFFPPTFFPGDTSLIVNIAELFILQGIPQWISIDAGPPIACESFGDDAILITWSDPVGSFITIPFQDPAIRNYVAGYVLPAVLNAS